MSPMEMGLTEKELKQIFTYQMLQSFKKWMYGQTCCMHEGEIIYYFCDISRFIGYWKSGQQHPLTWD